MELLAHAYQEKETRGPDRPPSWGPWGKRPQNKGYGSSRLEHFVHIVAEFAFGDGPRALVVALKSGDLTTEDGSIAITIAAGKKRKRDTMRKVPDIARVYNF